ncbi:hypothetical protein NHH88_04280 [Oxalobacteraceae bacterium OTU3CAMAD1]|nr:hypothetical protein NHH88_04280 [Oxalobacteraceae bacterium OTU3CAMAD1]
MKKLSAFKEFVSIQEAANNLSLAMNETVTESDVYRLALDGYLKLSAYLVNDTPAIEGQFVDLDEGQSQHLPPDLVLDERYFCVRKSVRTIRGIWDLPLIGNEKFDIEHKYQTLTSGPHVTLISRIGALVEAPDGKIFQLLEKRDSSATSSTNPMTLEEYVASDQFQIDDAIWAIRKTESERLSQQERTRTKNDPLNYFPAPTLPEDSYLVIRTRSLADFQSLHCGASKKNEELSGRERTSLHRIIATLCGLAKLDLTKPSKTAALIKLEASLKGYDIGETTIEEHLKKVRDVA